MKPRKISWSIPRFMKDIFTFLSNISTPRSKNLMTTNRSKHSMSTSKTTSSHSKLRTQKQLTLSSISLISRSSRRQLSHIRSNTKQRLMCHKKKTKELRLDRIKIIRSNTLRTWWRKMSMIEQLDGNLRPTSKIKSRISDAKFGLNHKKINLRCLKLRNSSEIAP